MHELGETQADEGVKQGDVYETFKIETGEHAGKSCTVREATPQDAAGVLALKLEILRHGIYDALLAEEYTFDTEQEAHLIEQNQQSDASFMVVCAIENDIVGVLYFQSSNELRCRHWGEFGMGVRDGLRGQKIGTKLMDALFKWAETTPGIEKICLKVFDENKDAHRFYQNLGFVEEGRLKKCLRLKEGAYADAVLMAKFINKDKKQSKT